jgi:hypothetical protein
MDTAANGVTRTFSDNRNTGNENNPTGDIVVRNGMYKNGAES